MNLLNNHFRYMLLASNRQQTELGNTIITTVTHVILKCLLVPLFGINGAALGTLGGEMMAFCLGLWSTRGDLLRKGSSE